ACVGRRVKGLVVEVPPDDRRRLDDRQLAGVDGAVAGVEAGNVAVRPALAVVAREAVSVVVLAAVDRRAVEHGLVLVVVGLGVEGGVALSADPGPVAAGRRVAVTRAVAKLGLEVGGALGRLAAGDVL